MSRLVRMLAVLAIASGVLPLLAAQSAERGTRYAFLVGCSKYLPTQFRELPYTGNDVADFRDALLATGFDADHIVLLHDAAKDPRRYLPEKARILGELALLLNGMRPEDTLVVALSGHGLQYKGDPVSYFVPLDGKVGDKSTLLALSGKSGLYEKLKTCKAAKKLLVVNACRNDPTANLDLAPNKIELVDEDRPEVPEGIAAIYSCQAGQKSYFDHRKRSLFFDHVIRAWRGEYVKEGKVTLETFFDQVTVRTKADAAKNLQAAQVPVVEREYKGEWIIAAKPVGGAMDNLPAVAPGAKMELIGRWNASNGTLANFFEFKADKTCRWGKVPYTYEFKNNRLSIYWDQKGMPLLWWEGTVKDWPEDGRFTLQCTLSKTSTAPAEMRSIWEFRRVP